jgi:hypothetical protein
MDEDARARADARLDEALARATIADPRDAYRARMKLLKDRDPAAFERAREHFQAAVVPRIADGGADPLAEWIEYGRFLAGLTGTGRTVDIAPDGRASPYEPPPGPSSLVLHLPDDLSEPVLVLRRPRELAPPQHAACELLIR